jgi:hypothetical protein
MAVGVPPTLNVFTTSSDLSDRTDSVPSPGLVKKPNCYSASNAMSWWPK